MNVFGLMPFAFLLLFVGGWTGVSYLLSVVGGWSRLAESFRYDLRPDVPLKVTSAKIGRVDYNNAVRVGFSEQGIHLRVLFLFRVNHPPLLIPWTAIRSHKHKKILWFWTRDVLQVGSAPSVRITLHVPVPVHLLGAAEPTHQTGPKVQIL